MELSVRKMPEAEHPNFPPNSCVPLLCPPLPHPGWVNPDPLMETCGSIPFACFWFRQGHVTSSSQWGVRSLLGATGKGFFAPIKRHKEAAPFPLLDVVCGCLPGAMAATLRL